jgi:poly(3-hydroxybutyrate) depolymerase
MKGIAIFTLTLILGGICTAKAESPPMTDSDYILSMPKTANGALPVVVALPGKNVPASSDLPNWKFMANKRGFVLVNMDIDYATIKTESDVERFHDRIFQIIRGLPKQGIHIEAKRIYLVGTSMGGMMALSLSLRHPHDFVATSIVSGGRMRFNADKFLDNAKGLRFYLAHGEKDNVVPIDYFYQTKEALQSHGAIVTYDIYPGAGHILSGAYKKAFDRLVTLD